MFTGIIEELGTITSLDQYEGGARIRVSALMVVEDTNEGDSIAVNGVCLTALDITLDSFSADLSCETLERTTLSRLKPDTPVNLERAVTPQTRLGGHIVQGHVDGRGTFVSAVRDGDFWTVKIGFPPEMAHYFVYKGSVAVEGISLTIAALYDDSFDIAIIPKTWELTNLASLHPGDEVNLEADVIAKYVERMMGLVNDQKRSISDHAPVSENS
ncbi:MAG: riboflavin synthase [Acidobacteriota bacterium]